MSLISIIKKYFIFLIFFIFLNLFYIFNNIYSVLSYKFSISSSSGNFITYPTLDYYHLNELINNSLSEIKYIDKKEFKNVKNNINFTLTKKICINKKKPYYCDFIELDFFNSSFSKSTTLYIKKNFIKNFEVEFDKLTNLFLYEHFNHKYQKKYNFNLIEVKHIEIKNYFQLICLNLILFIYFFIFKYRVPILNKLYAN